MSDLRITLIQTSLAWHDPVANRRMFDDLLAPLKGHTDVIVLPEMFTTGFTMEPERVAEDSGGASVQWMRTEALELKATLTGSIATRDGNRYFNRLTWMRPDGTSASYDKRHLFRMAREHEHYSAGAERLIVELNGWRICPMVCYDLRFPVWSRNRSDYDVLIYVANWPERRRHAWRTLLQARAIENLSYCIGVNRVGPDKSGIAHSGDSLALDMLGQPLLAESQSAFVQTVTLSREALLEHRRKFPAHLDADNFALQID